MTTGNWEIIWFTIRVAALSTVLILPVGIALAWLLARRDWPGKSFVETLIVLPLVMPPVAVGLILLKLFGRYGPFGGLLERYFDLPIVFTWRGVVLATAVLSFPLLVRAIRVAFQDVNPRLEQIAATLGASPLRVFFTITLPLARRGVVAGALLAFSRALGEFGATIMVAGYIPGKTATISLTIYNLVQLGQDGAALRLLGVSVLLVFFVVWLSEWYYRRSR